MTDSAPNPSRDPSIACGLGRAPRTSPGEGAGPPFGCAGSAARLGFDGRPPAQLGGGQTPGAAHLTRPQAGPAGGAAPTARRVERACACDSHDSEFLLYAGPATAALGQRAAAALHAR